MRMYNQYTFASDAYEEGWPDAYSEITALVKRVEELEASLTFISTADESVAHRTLTAIAEQALANKET